MHINKFSKCTLCSGLNGTQEMRMENLCQSLNQVFDRRQSHNNSADTGPGIT